MFCNKQTIVSKQQTFGETINPMHDLIEIGLLPETMRSYRQPFFATFDIETLAQRCDEQRTERQTIQSKLCVVSVAVSTNLPGTTDQFFCDSDEEKLTLKFLDYTAQLQELLEQNLPNEIVQCREKLSELVHDETFGVKKCKMRTMLNYVKGFFKLSCYGFNSSK